MEQIDLKSSITLINGLEPQAVCVDVLAEKYCKHGERSIREVRWRVAQALAANETQEREAWAQRFLWAQEHGFVAAGRINSAAGTQLKATLINCFVQPVGDTISGADDEGRVGIYEALLQAAETMRRGGGVGYDFSSIRPKGALVRGTDSRASGPVSYMRVFNQSCATVESAGARRGAQMGILRCDHPDIEEFVQTKSIAGELTNFNLSVAVTDAFMEAAIADEPWPLVHRAEPNDDAKAAGAFRRDDGLWVYRSVAAKALLDTLIRSTYDAAEPGIVFIDRVNQDNNLRYAERIESTNPCSEQPLPAYGCCCLGSINLAQFVRQPFSESADFDWEAFGAVVDVGVRMLDNVLDVTPWPLPEQQREAQSKRRVGLGFLGLGDALTMLGIAYDSNEAVVLAGELSRRMRDRAYAASVALAQERGAFPLFDAERYLGGESCASRLPEAIKAQIREHGVRNSHLLSIAPTGTISLAFADNASNGIEPAYSWSYTRKKRMPDGSNKEYEVLDHAYRLYRRLHPDAALPAYFRNALEISVDAHLAVMAAVQPYVDSAISKTVNVPVDYAFDDFEDIYIRAWRMELKSVATYRPSPVRGAVLEVKAGTPGTAAAPADLDTSDPDRRIALAAIPHPALASLRWPGRPKLRGGNPAWTYMLEHPSGSFAVFVGHVENGGSRPFEVWVNGAEQPRGLGALAKTLSMDMRADDRPWLRAKIESLLKAAGDDGFDLTLPDGTIKRMPSLVAGFAAIVKARLEELGAWEPRPGDASPVLDAMFSRKEPKAGPDGTMSWTVDIFNPSTGDDFVLGLKELMLPNGQRRPFSVWLAGEYPRALDGLCKTLSLDMRVIDPAWIGMKLRKLVEFPEPLGDFLAREPMSEKQFRYPSTVAYVARLIIHRYAMLGVLTEQGQPIQAMGVLSHPEADAETELAPRPAVQPGKRCGECGNLAVIRKDGCDYCTACGYLGACG